MAFSHLKFSDLVCIVMIAIAVIEAAATELFLWSSVLDNLADYEVVRSYAAESIFQCLGLASRSEPKQRVLFNMSTGVCSELQCRQGMAQCQKCREKHLHNETLWARDTACWTTAQHRVSDSVDFYVGWSSYKAGFGEGPNGNFWLGLENLYALTKNKPLQLMFLMQLWNDTQGWAYYTTFSVANESDFYRLRVSGFSASPGVGNSMVAGNGHQFTTKYEDHDTHESLNCAEHFKGAWWFSACHSTHPNGQYKPYANAIGGVYAQGIIWNLHYGYYYSMKEIEMLVM